MWDTQMIMEKRRRGDKDFIAHSLDLFIDFMQVFRKVLVLLMQKVSFWRTIVHNIALSHTVWKLQNFLSLWFYVKSISAEFNILDTSWLLMLLV